MTTENRPTGPDWEDPRVSLAAERTLLAWIRTGLAMMGFGFVVARFGLFLREMTGLGREVPGHQAGLSLVIGTALVLLGVAVNLLAARQYSRFLKRLPSGEGYAPGGTLGIAVSLILAALGLGMVAYLIGVSL